MRVELMHSSFSLFIVHLLFHCFVERASKIKSTGNLANTGPRSFARAHASFAHSIHSPTYATCYEEIITTVPSHLILLFPSVIFKNKVIGISFLKVN